MNPGLRAAASGMAAQQLRVDTIANNLANVNTTGFKKSRVCFEDVLYQTIEGTRIVNYPNSETVGPMQVGRGVRAAAILRDHSQGATVQTGRTLDLAISGEGLFQVQRPDGTTAYTRDGTFTISDTGAIVTSGGYALLPTITVPPEATQLNISATGAVSATVANSTDAVQLGQIELARFVNPSGLLSLGENLYAQTAASGQPMTGQPQADGFGQILQGTQETSNVDVVEEMVDMIAAQRAYEVNSKAIQSADSMIQEANALLR
ncbi:MAG TPA: flagellar basal-body rod protein FlgG [Gemmatimonadales bacterium]|nr:flagellar basal-body rod protein FlgG [Gemmatimonadales bacterium]